jgi:hypothetical protein
MAMGGRGRGGRGVEGSVRAGRGGGGREVCVDFALTGRLAFCDEENGRYHGWMVHGGELHICDATVSVTLLGSHVVTL